MAKKEAPAEVALGSGAGVARHVDAPHHSKNDAETPARPVYVLKLEPMPGVDGHKALRELLKRARRNHGLACRACHEEPGQ